MFLIGGNHPKSTEVDQRARPDGWSTNELPVSRSLLVATGGQQPLYLQGKSLATRPRRQQDFETENLFFEPPHKAGKRKKTNSR